MDEIRDVIERKAALLEQGDAKAILAHYAPTFVEFTLAPPLRQPGDARDPGPLEAWIATFEAPPRRTVTHLEITTDGDVAFATSLDCLSAVPRGAAERFTLWFRVTLGLRRIDGRWLVTHEHESVPFEMDGSLRASVGLLPPG
ncbi:YybH family protein [Dactylosporangium matsuzakiense]|uniref:Ketosteroid isomerase n=1 Tax=Dactylosporangium matsuzakiense TaxID=53360 RepID=A0A9W6KTW1_9ACTN|nr:nuclear transport factor 2 family protein [Dactylosporangium matsuzakiense]UWZ41725.1 nuclear transport factor 2 family protein [Dactylosporangium matsuzakiense]GLL07132.1 ketosteroid isomerase [Dactylosporangium matsuzakiense]